jgi:multidrug efflux pump subunit AcrB
VVLFAGSLMLVPMIGGEFVPQTDDGFIQLKFKTPVGSSLHYTDAKVHQVEAALKAFRKSRACRPCRRLGGPQRSEINLKLTDVHKTHRRSQQEMER